MPGVFTSARRFAVVGCIATAIHVLVVVGLVELAAMRPFSANFIAFCLALVVSYFGSHRWAFEASGCHTNHFPRFAAVALIGLGLNQAILYGGMNVLGLTYGVSLAIVVMVVPSISFASSRFWAFGTTTRQPVASSKT